MEILKGSNKRIPDITRKSISTLEKILKKDHPASLPHPALSVSVSFYLSI